VARGGVPWVESIGEGDKLGTGQKDKRRTSEIRKGAVAAVKEIGDD